MLIRSTRFNYLAQLALSILLALALWTPNFWMNTSPKVVDSPTFLYSLLFGWTKTHTMLAKILAFVCVFLQAFMLGELVRTHALSKNPMLVGLIYIVLMSAQSDWQTLHPFLISNFFIIGGFSYLFKTYDRKEPYEYVFNASALLALASLFSASLLPFGLIIFWVFLFYPINRWREWLIAILGFAFPFSALFLWTSLTENLDVFSEFLTPITEFENFGKTFENAAWTIQIFILAVLLFSFVGVRFLNARGRYNEISQRKKVMAVMLGLFWVVIVAIFMSNHALPAYLATLFVFSAFFIAEWFGQSQRKWLPELVFYVFVIAAFGVQYL
ncbi:MAG: hypothetical protein FWC94_01985 [Bacteroidales bacterium]|nr:hypothetical protein [Bacteroidales bacterium]